MNRNLFIKNAAELVTCSGFKAKQGKEMQDLGVIQDGAVIVREGMIEAVGTTKSLVQAYGESALLKSGFEILDASHKAVLPGFVDSHTHLVFGGYRAEEFSWRLQGLSYMDIMKRGGGIVSTVEATKKASRQELLGSALRRLNALLAFGVTTVESKSGYGLDHDTEIKQLEVMEDLDRVHPIDIIKTFLGAHAVPAQFKENSDEFIDFMSEEVLPEVTERHLAAFCDVFCEQNVFSIEQSRRLLIRAKSMGLKLTLHADEIARLGGAELAAELGAVSAAHLLQASDHGIQQLAEAGVVATLLPATAFSLKAPYARARYMIDHNCAVALATDLNPGSCFTESIPLIIALATLYMDMTPEETVTALTINGAAAVDYAGITGSLDVGKSGDLIILQFPSYKYLPYHIGANTVEKVFKKGTLVYDAEKGGIVSCSQLWR